LISERFAFLRQAVAANAALDAAFNLGVLARLEAGPARPGDLARDCGIGERGASSLLAVLAGLGIAEISGDGLYHAATGVLGQLDALRTPWAHLADAIRTDQPVTAGDTVSGASGLYPALVPQLGAMFSTVAERAADHLAAPGLRILDAGAGAAPWSLALAARDPQCRVVALDIPAVIASTRTAVASAGLEAQFHFLEGDLFTVEYGPEPFDLAIAGNICHLFEERRNHLLLRRLFDALRPGGKLAVLDILPAERLDGPLPVALYALGLLLRTSTGRVYPFSTFAGWLREAGFELIETTVLSADLPISLIAASRPM